jgi:hypothetical protein
VHDRFELYLVRPKSFGYTQSGVICPNCAARLDGAPPLCPRCGHPILEDDRTTRIDFDGGAVEALGWLLLALVSAIVIIPFAWTVAAIARWFCRNLKFRDGTTVEFTGKGSEILGWILLSCLVQAPVSIAGRLQAPVGTLVILVLVSGAVSVFVHLAILRWAAANLRLSTGPPLRFVGEFAGFLGYHVLIAVSAITIIGWAWAEAAYYRWIARNTHGEGIAFHFEGTGWEILWRSLVALLGSILIVTIPWMLVWYARWLVSCVTMTRGAEPSDV